jgi:hypothetical protein
MNKKFLIIGGLIVIALVVFYSLRISGNEVIDNEESYNIEVVENEPVDKIEVVHFHATNQCFSCTTVGEFALKTIKEKFKNEYENGVIVFLDINSELEENKEIVAKYGARGSSLFVNGISDDVDNIKEDTTVWRLVYNEDYFMEYFEKELNNLLGR